ncbi:MAG: DNA repair protein RecN, partial [Gammaproteobacteria bacterium]
VGSSIRIDSFSLVLGSRPTPASVRPVPGRAEIAATFDLYDAQAAAAWLRKHELSETEQGDDQDGDDQDGDDQDGGSACCIVRRVIGLKGASRAFVNDRPVSVGALKALGELLVNVHGQHAQQSLQRPGAARSVLDAFAQRKDAEHARYLASVHALSASWREVREQIEALSGPNGDHDSRLEWLRFQLDELQANGPSPGELERLEREHSLLAHARELEQGCADASVALQGRDDSSATDGGAAGQLTTAIQALNAVEPYDPSLGEIVAMLDSALVEIGEAAAGLRHRDTRVEVEGGSLEAVERRLGELHDLARKHKVQPEELDATRERLQAQVESLGHGRDRVQELEREAERLQSGYAHAAATLSRSRAAAAARFDPALSAAMAELGIHKGRFETHLAKISGCEVAPPARHGDDRVEFRVSTNPGQPAKPLAEIASGGELSRIALAIMVIAAAQDGAPTLIFDEVDTGVGGRVADMVGRRLSALTERHQVMCVTHLPQVASHAEQHLQVEKHADDERTRTSIRALDAEHRVHELARMLGGAKITKQTLAHAREMLGQ